MKKTYKNWNLGFFYMTFTYDGLLEGRPSPLLDKMILDNAQANLNKLRYDEDNLTIIEKRQETGELKPVMVNFELYDYEPQIKGVIITFCDYKDSIEDVVERVIQEKPDFKTVEWDF